MTIEVDVLADMYSTLKEYISTKDRQAAADHVFSVLLDSGVSEEEIKSFSGVDSYLKRSYEEYMGPPDEDEDEEQDYDYGDDD